MAIIAVVVTGCCIQGWWYENAIGEVFELNDLHSITGNKMAVMGYALADTPYNRKAWLEDRYHVSYEQALRSSFYIAQIDYALPDQSTNRVLSQLLRQ